MAAPLSLPVRSTPESAPLAPYRAVPSHISPGNLSERGRITMFSRCPRAQPGFPAWDIISAHHRERRAFIGPYLIPRIGVRRLIRPLRPTGHYYAH